MAGDVVISKWSDTVISLPAAGSIFVVAYGPNKALRFKGFAVPRTQLRPMPLMPDARLEFKIAAYESEPV